MGKKEIQQVPKIRLEMTHPFYEMHNGFRLTVY